MEHLEFPLSSANDYCHKCSKVVKVNHCNFIRQILLYEVVKSQTNNVSITRNIFYVILMDNKKKFNLSF